MNAFQRRQFDTSTKQVVGTLNPGKGGERQPAPRFQAPISPNSWPHPIWRWHTGRLSYHEAQTMTTAKSSSFSEWLSKAHSLPGPQISFWEKWSWAAFMTSWLAENSSLLLHTPSCWLKCHFHGGLCPDQIDNIRSPCHGLSGLLKSLPVPSLMRQCG